MQHIRHYLFLLLPALALVAGAMFVSHDFLAPLPQGGCFETLLPEHDCVVWSYQKYNPPDQPSHVAQLDLKTGQVSRVKLAKVAVMLEPRRGLRVDNYNGIGIYDSSGNSLWQDPTQGFEYLVGDRYLLRQQHGQLTILDMAPVFDNPTRDQKLESEPLVLNVPGLIERYIWLHHAVVQPIAGTNRFLCVSRDVPIGVSVYEIEAGQVRLVDSWPYGGGPVIQHAGKIWSSVPKKREVEVRSLADLQIVKRLQLPTEMTDWVTLTHRHDLFCFTSQKTRQVIVCRLSDFQPIPELNMPLLTDCAEQQAEDRRFHLLTDGQKLNSRRVVVYDSELSRIVYDASLPMGLLEVGVDDGHLVLVTAAMGLTVELIDLSTGKVSRTHRPFVGSLLLITVVGWLALIWLVAWCYCSNKWRLSPLVSIILLSLLIGTPFMWRIQTIGYFNILRRPAVDCLLVILFTHCFLVALYAAYGPQRLLLRLSVLFLWLAACAFVPAGFGWRRVPQLFHVHSVEGVLWTVLVFTLGSTLVLFALRVTSIRRYFSPALPVASDKRSAAMSVWDIFVFIASSAVFITAVRPVGLIAREDQVYILGISAWILLPAMLGLVGLIRHEKLFRVVAMIQFALGCVVILAATFRLALGQYGRDILYAFAGDAISLLLLMLATFVVCSLMRKPQPVSST